jgi:phage terminase large subunit-like protein
MTAEAPELAGGTLKELEAALQQLADQKRYRRIDFFEPYDKQREFFANGATKRERLLSAGNQLGKTEAGAFETACHLTGQYPDWWPGRRFTHAPRGWADGETGLLVRDVQQKKLCGQPGVDADWGTGFIPKAALLDKSLARGVTDAYDTIQVRHVSGGISTLTFKSYEQGRQKHQGEPVDFIWCDEEPPEDVYTEIVTRTNATGGLVYTTFTPLKGMSSVVMRFFSPADDDDGAKERALTIMVIEDAKHIPPEQRAKIIASYPAHEREARTRGVPLLGSGRIFQISEEQVREPLIEYIPAHWCKLWALDFGIDHPFAAILLLWDKDNDVVHIHHAVRIKDQFPINHAAVLKRIGANVPVAWPHDGNQRRQDGTVGTTLALQYRTQGLKMLPTHATFPDGGYSTEAGIMEMQERFRESRLKVASHLTEWFEEYRLYHRKDGLIVKQNDDLMSATRIGVMARRFARPVALGSHVARKSNTGVASDIEFELF